MGVQNRQEVESGGGFEPLNQVKISENIWSNRSKKSNEKKGPKMRHWAKRHRVCIETPIIRMGLHWTNHPFLRNCRYHSKSQFKKITKIYFTNSAFLLKIFVTGILCHLRRRHYVMGLLVTGELYTCHQINIWLQLCMMVMVLILSYITIQRAGAGFSITHY